jgi:oxygen-independent coproporphyrinogen III oxidase
MIETVARPTRELVEKYDVPGPYYTSYPDLSRWTPPSAAHHQKKLYQALESLKQEPVSLYVHFPFCPKICWYCICKTIVTREQDKINNFLDYLFKEIEQLYKFFQSHSLEPNIKEVHFGGGSPSFLSEKQFTDLQEKLGLLVNMDTLWEGIIEVDVRTISLEKLEFYRNHRINRLSFGVQDFNPDVQKAVNRIQPFDLIEKFVKQARALGFDSVNFDLIYGLPFQTRDSFKETTKQALSLEPDRICLYNYCHNPEVNLHQKLISAAALPSRFEEKMINIDSINYFLKNGFHRIGLDHFSKDGDGLAEARKTGTLERIFNGYAPGRTKNLLGIGPTSSSSINSCYCQNLGLEQGYINALEQGEMPVLRAYEMNADDVLRRKLINELICYFRCDFEKFEEQSGIIFQDYFKNELARLSILQDDGLVDITEKTILITPLGQNFVRNICAAFDGFL